VIKNDEGARSRLEREEIATWGPFDFVILNVLAELVRCQSRLMGLEEVEYALAHLLDETRDGVETNPVVWAVLERFSLGDLTRIFRAMLDERLSLADLRTLLEHIAQFETISIDDPWLEVVDDRLPVAGDAATGAAAGWQLVYAYLRRQLKPYLSRKYIWFDHTVLAYALSDETEERLMNGPSVTDAEAETLRDAMWTELGQLAPSPFGQVLLVNSAVRPQVRALLAPELPDLAVVAPSELNPDVVIQPLATIDPHWERVADAA
jgi:flagellar biosynthesis component FlhA